MLGSQLEVVEKRIRGLRLEHAYVFAPDGQFRFRKSSREARRVQFSDEEFALLKGAVLTHNHPDGGSLSEQDLRTAMHAGLLQVRAVTRSHRYWVDCPADGWTSGARTIVSTAMVVERAALRAELGYAVVRGELTRGEAGRALHHLLWTRLARDAILVYGWEPWPA
jgi:hypothetical protein